MVIRPVSVRRHQRSGGRAGLRPSCPSHLTTRSGAGGNRTLVRRAVIARATPIPEISALRLPPCRVRRIRGSHRRVFPRRQWSFPPSAVFPCCLHRFCCRAAVDRPRAPLLVTMTLGSPDQIRRRERTAHRRFFGVPRLASLSNSGRTQRLPVPPSKPISPWCGAHSTRGRPVRDATSPGPPPGRRRAAR